VISKSFPEHIACPEASPWLKYANEPPSGQLRIASPNTTQFTADLIGSVADLFPGQYFGTGGDEINSPCYAEDEETQTALNSTGKSFEQALDAFTQATHKVLKGKGKTVVVWEGS
jgi:hexosaminidase